MKKIVDFEERWKHRNKEKGRRRADKGVDQEEMQEALEKNSGRLLKLRRQLLELE